MDLITKIKCLINAHSWKYWYKGHLDDYYFKCNHCDKVEKRIIYQKGIQTLFND